MAVIVFDETSPADGDSAGLGDDQIRALKIALRTAMDAEHVFPSGGGDAGVHRLGSARAFYGASSRVSSSGTDGRLMVTSDTSRLYHVGSGGTMFLGGARAIEHYDTTPGETPGTSRWAIYSGVASVGAGATATFSGLPFGGLPIVFGSVVSNAVGAAYVTAITVPNATQFSIKAFLVSSGGTLIPTASTTSIQYFSMGTVVT